MNDEPTKDSTPQPAAPVDGEPAAAAPAEAEAEEQEWWDDEGMPWKKKPGRADYWCLAWFGFIGVFSLALLPIRAWAYANAPDILAMVTGGRTAVAISGALASQGQMPHWPIVLIVASILSLKFDWVYWWAGKLWGRGMIEVWAGQSKRAARNYARAERWAEKLGPWAFLVAYIPIPLPLMQVVFVLSGATNMSLKRFLIYDYIASTLWLVLYFYLGWRFGEPIVDVLAAYAKIAMWVALAMVAFIFVSTYLAQSRKAKADAAAKADAKQD
ncbi:MAG TPA: DedA family protein [Tessaracoccus flavescens]|uniref:DedA family protein n=1 Tax=Tessaracoccus flavescens TaxID=399497 RepID=A0A921JPZ5_9ACTN|nr:DedA family protein [Tessaracoccus flavescens]